VTASCLGIIKLLHFIALSQRPKRTSFCFVRVDCCARIYVMCPSLIPFSFVAPRLRAFFRMSLVLFSASEYNCIPASFRHLGMVICSTEPRVTRRFIIATQRRSRPPCACSLVHASLKATRVAEPRAQVRHRGGPAAGSLSLHRSPRRRVEPG
jgi:hypothetical protein